MVEVKVLVEGGHRKNTKGDLMISATVTLIKTDKNIIYHPRWFHIRNRSLVDYADMVVAFWDGNAGGTKNTIDYANRVNKRTLVIRFQYPMH